MTTYTAGNFSVSGFVADNSNNPFAPVLSFADSPNPIDDYVFNWGNTFDAAGNNFGGEIIAVGATSDHWSLTVSLQSYTAPSFDSSVGGEQLFAGANLLAGGDLDGTGFTATGNGSTSLQNFIRSLHVDTPNGGPDAYAISFDLTDVTATGNQVWTEFYDNPTPCYATGTRIAVPGGEKAVEDLRIGDLVMTATGVAKPVKWLGRRSYTAAKAAANPHVRSVLVRKDAIAPAMPHRDLSVSPMHALFINDVFVPAASLVNGVSILRNDDLAPVSYVHIEMDGHDVIFAEGQPAETFVDDDSRQMFDNADEYYSIYGADQGRASFSAPRIEEGIQLEMLRRRIAARAGLPAPAASTGKLQGHVERLEDGVLHGWVLDTANASAPVELEVLVDGEVAATAIANRYRADLDYHGLAGGRAGFTVALPASVTSLAQVSVRRTADRARVAMPQTALVD